MIKLLNLASFKFAMYVAGPYSPKIGGPNCLCLRRCLGLKKAEFVLKHKAYFFITSSFVWTVLLFDLKNKTAHARERWKTFALEYEFSFTVFVSLVRQPASSGLILRSWHKLLIQRILVHWFPFSTLDHKHEVVNALVSVCNFLPLSLIHIDSWREHPVSSVLHLCDCLQQESNFFGFFGHCLMYICTRVSQSPT